MSYARMIGLVVALSVVAGAAVAGDLLGADPTPVPATARGAASTVQPGLVPSRSAEDPEPPPDSAMKYRLPQQALPGLPGGIQLKALTKRFGAGQGPKGIQYFQSSKGLFGMFLLQGDALQAQPLLFPVRNQWRFLPDRRFEQVDQSGNRLVLGAGKAQVFDGARIQIGALEDPGLLLLYNALLRLTM